VNLRCYTRHLQELYGVAYPSRNRNDIFLLRLDVLPPREAGAGVRTTLKRGDAVTNVWQTTPATKVTSTSEISLKRKQERTHGASF